MTAGNRMTLIEKSLFSQGIVIDISGLSQRRSNRREITFETESEFFFTRQ